jgi:3-phenylpropionate/trans-cinnamate dioxygenase alpha subunit
MSQMQRNGAAGTTTNGHVDVTRLVDPERGVVQRSVYVDRDVYDLEMQRVFGHSWLFVAHVSQLPEPGDYLTTFMGEDPVIVVRGADGVIRAFLNACRHRGMRVCRADEGNTSFFRCPYHSWTYSTNGNLRGVPKFRQAYEGTLDKSQWGLHPVAQLDEYRGFVFATWDAQAPPLKDYLGDFAFYLDLVFGRDPAGVELVSGAHKWTIDSNWKHPVENFACDMYHVEFAHQRPAELGLMGDMSDTGFELSAGMGYVGHDLSRPVTAEDDGEDSVHGYWTMPNAYTEVLKEQRRRIAAEHGEMAARMVPMGHGNVFPSFSFLDLEQLRLVRVQHPLGPDKVMVYQWCAIDASVPDDVKEALRRQYELTFGPAGLLEQDDGENWRECQNGMAGPVGRTLNTNMMLGLGQDTTMADMLGADLPGQGGNIWSEANQRQFYRHWTAFMTAEDGWSEIGPRLAEIERGVAR